MAQPKQSSINIVPVRTASQVACAKNLFTTYAATPGIGSSLSAQRFAHELETLPASYTPPGGDLLLALQPDGRAVGCIAVRPLPSGSGIAAAGQSGPSPHFCEMKRLYVLPSVQGLGVGRALVTAALTRAAELGYEEVRLDTLPFMEAAVRLYEGCGFERIGAYHEQWGTGNEELLFFKKDLR